MLGVATSFSALDRFLFGLLAPMLKRDLHLSDTSLGMMSGLAFASIYAVASLPIARLADRGNRRTIISIGFLVWSLVTLISGLVQTGTQMIAARFALGAAEASASAPANSIIGDLFPLRHRALALSIFAAMSPLGFLIGFPILGWIAQTYNWRYAFLTAGLAGIAIAILFRLTVSEPARSHIGAGKPPPPRANFGGALHRLLSTPRFLLATGCLAFYMVNVSAMQTWLPSFLDRSHGLGVAESGKWIGLLRGIAGTIGAIIAGSATTWLARFNSAWLYRVPAFCLLMMVPSEFVLLFARDATTWQAGLGIETFFGTALLGPLFAIIISAAPAEMRALSFAVASIVGQLMGQSLGPLGVGAVSDLIAPGMGPDSLRFALLIATASAGIAGVLCVFANRPDRDDTSEF